MLGGRPCCVKNAWWSVNKEVNARAWKKDVQTAPLD